MEPALERCEMSGIITPFSSDEIIDSRLSSRTCADPDGIEPKRWNAVPLSVKRLLFHCFVLMGELPKELLEAESTFIPKIDSPNSPGVYRPITVASVIVRHFHKLLARRLAVQCSHSPAQCGFIAGLDGVGENVLRLNALLRKARNSRRSLVLVSLDVAKAFDSVSHNAILRTMEAKGVPLPLVNYVRSCLSRSFLRLRWKSERSRPIRVGRGVRQGDPLSPLLFNLVMDHIIGGLPERVGFWTGVADQRINSMAYADDLSVSR